MNFALAVNVEGSGGRSREIVNVMFALQYFSSTESNPGAFAGLGDAVAGAFISGVSFHRWLCDGVGVIRCLGVAGGGGLARGAAGPRIRRG